MERNIVFRIVGGYSRKILPLIVAFPLLFFFFSCEKDDDNDTRSQTELKVEEYFPNSGKGGTLVTIKGKGFTPNLNSNTVEFSGTKATIFSATADELVVLAPESGQSGMIKISNGNQSVDAGNYVYQDLTISGFSPLNGPAGTNIRISGQGFSSLQGPAKVTVNGIDAVVVNASDTLIVAKVPEDAGKGQIKVFVDGKESTGQSFIYQAIHSIKPLTGGAGTKLTISGEGFDTDLTKNMVYFNRLQAKVLEASEDKIVVEVPQQVETNKVSIIVNEQKTVSNDIFTVVPPPSLSLVIPLSGPVGSTITIQGLYFSKILEENKVAINGKEIALESSTNNTLTFTFPPNVGSGELEVSVNDQRVVGPVFTNQQLGILKVTPESGLANTEITIEGTGFSSDPAQNKVLFNGVEAIITAATETKLTVVAPTDLTTGALKVETNGMVAEAPKAFRRSGVVTIIRDLTILDNNYSRIRVDSYGNIYVNGSSKIYKITQEGTMSVFAEGFSSTIRGLEIYQDNIYVMDGAVLKKITLDGTISNINTSSITSPLPNGLTADNHGNMYISKSYSGVHKITLPAGTVTSMGTGNVSEICRIAVAEDGTIYNSSDSYEGIIRKKTLANSSGQDWIGGYGNYGYVDGPVTTARINYGPRALQFNSAGNLLILDANNFAIREVDMVAETVSTIVKVTRGFTDGDLVSAQWGYAPSDMAIDKDDNIYLLDTSNKAVRKIILK